MGPATTLPSQPFPGRPSRAAFTGPTGVRHPPDRTAFTGCVDGCWPTTTRFQRPPRAHPDREDAAWEVFKMATHVNLMECWGDDGPAAQRPLQAVRLDANETAVVP